MTIQSQLLRKELERIWTEWPCMNSWYINCWRITTPDYYCWAYGIVKIAVSKGKLMFKRTKGQVERRRGFQ